MDSPFRRGVGKMREHLSEDQVLKPGIQNTLFQKLDDEFGMVRMQIMVLLDQVVNRPCILIPSAGVNMPSS